ncbi:MAG: PilZ domain-containing protein [Desulfotalea sp.]
MVSEAIIKKITSIKLGQACFLNFKLGSDEQRLDCTLLSVEGDVMLFDLTYTPKYKLKEDQGISFSTAPSLAMATISCETDVVSHSGREIRIKAIGEIDPATFRNNFRVNIRVPIELKHGQDLPEGHPHHWSTTGESIDISMSGLLCILATEAPIDGNIELTMNLPDPKGKATCIANIIRIKRLTRTRWLTALHFKSINEKNSDIVLSNCLQEQRRQIRENVKLN